MSSCSSALRSFFLLVLTLTAFALLDSKDTHRHDNEGVLDRHYHILTRPFGGNGGAGEDFAFGSRDGQSFPQQVESAFIMEDEAQATQVWPRVIMDYMRHQLRFRGRTKKSMKI